MEATVEGAAVAVGGPALLPQLELGEPAGIAPATEGWRARGAAVLYVLQDGAVVGALALEDEIRPESRQAVDGLHALGVRVVMITGDARQVRHRPVLVLPGPEGGDGGRRGERCIESAGVVLASSDPRSVTGVIRLSRASYRKMLQNLAWGAGYNLFAIPLAAGALAFAGFNAQLLRRLDLRPAPLDVS